jgi:Fe-Mn family superoxide dismutase
MLTLQPRAFANLGACDAVSKGALESHLRLYTGYVAKYNDLVEKVHTLQERGPAAIAEISSLKGDVTFALGAIKNHELYFDILGGDEQEPQGPLLDMLVKSFHSLPQYLVDLKHTALQARGWAWTAYDLDQQLLFNYEGRAGLPVWNAVPILAIDVYGHAYFYDFGNNKVAYVEAIMKSLHWTRIAERFQQATTASNS